MKKEPRNFSWVTVKGEKIAACSCPKSEAELMFLVEQGITNLVTLSTDTPPHESITGIKKLKSTIFPIREFSGPTVIKLWTYDSPK